VRRVKGQIKKPGDFLISKIRSVIWKMTDPCCLIVAFGGRILMKKRQSVCPLCDMKAISNASKESMGFVSEKILIGVEMRGQTWGRGEGIKSTIHCMLIGI
jgi:hypothetical protein